MPLKAIARVSVIMAVELYVYDLYAGAVILTLLTPKPADVAPHVVNIMHPTHLWPKEKSACQSCTLPRDTNNDIESNM